MYIYCVTLDVLLQLSAPQLQIGVTVTLAVGLRLDRNLVYVFFFLPVPLGQTSSMPVNPHLFPSLCDGGPCSLYTHP